MGAHRNPTRYSDVPQRAADVRTEDACPDGSIPVGFTLRSLFYFGEFDPLADPVILFYGYDKASIPGRKAPESHHQKQKGGYCMSQTLSRTLQTVGLLVVSNTFMTVAWYGHLKHKNSPLLLAILLSWAIALFEYVFQVPANRIGSGQFSLMQLKIMQECITLAVFMIYAFIIYRETLKWNYAVSMFLIVAAVYFAFIGGEDRKSTQTPPIQRTQESKNEEHSE